MSKYFTAVRDVDIDKIFKAVFKAFAAILIVFITLWNWDGFWQTNIKSHTSKIGMIGFITLVLLPTITTRPFST